MAILETTVTRRMRIDAPPDAVWEAVRTMGLGRLHLLQEEGEQKLREGARLEWFEPEKDTPIPHLKGRITVIARPRHIAFTAYMPSTGLPDVPENHTAVDITLEEEEDGRTLVTVEHGDFAGHPNGPRLARQVGQDWVEALIRLREFVEHGAAA